MLQNRKVNKPYSKEKESEKVWKSTKVKRCLKSTEKEMDNAEKLAKYIFSHIAP